MMTGADNQCLDALKADMDLIGTTIRENFVFRQVLVNPIIKTQQKRLVMSTLLDKRVHPLTLNFINLIIRNRREILLADISRVFIKLYEKSKGIKRAHVVSAAGMDDSTKQQLQQRLNALLQASVQLTSETNPDLIGGFILRMGFQQYDASLASALERMHKTLTN